MKRLAILLLTLASVLHSAPAQESDFKGDVHDVRVIRGVEQQPGSSLLWEPYIAQWKPRHLVASFGAGIPGKTDMGDILASVSTDDGNTWSEPVYVFDHHERFGAIQFGYANSVLYHPPGQDVLWCFAMRCPMNYRDSEDSQLTGAYSADGGRSWTPVELAMQYTGPLIIVAGIHRVVENGVPRYLLPAHRNMRRGDPDGPRDQFILSSTSLLEWRLAGHIPQPTAGRVFLHEGGLAPGDHDGELKLVMRTAQDGVRDSLPLDPPRAFSSVSQDGGKTWTPAQQEPDLWNSVSKAFFGRLDNGTHLYVYSDERSRMALRYKLQPPGAAWTQERTFFESGTHNSYPTLIEIAPGDFRAVWDSGTQQKARTRILFGKLRIENPAK